jgi:hypothetical protein
VGKLLGLVASFSLGAMAMGWMGERVAVGVAGVGLVVTSQLVGVGFRRSTEPLTGMVKPIKVNG